MANPKTGWCGQRFLTAGLCVLLGAGCPADGETVEEDTEGGGGTEAETTGSTTDAGSSSTTDATQSSTSPATTETTTSTTTDDPSESGEESGETTTTGDPPEICGDIPERMLIFGDSLFACFGLPDGKNAPGCSARLGHEYLADRYAPGVSYENDAVSGAITSDVVQSQMPNAAVGQPGHTMVVIWIGGNDISGLLLSSDMQAESTYRDELAPELDTLWDQMFAWVDDPANFPDGATLIVNTQFNPFDDCSADPYGFMTPLKTGLLAEYNARIAERIEGRPNTYVADQYPAFLGHGHHYATSACPNFAEGNAYWMIGGTDLVHPNALGHTTIAGALRSGIDSAFACE